VDSEVHPQGSKLGMLFSTQTEDSAVEKSLVVETRNGRSVVKATVPAGGVVVYK